MTQPPRSGQFDDVYFSADGGPEETIHVFLNGNNLPARWQGRPRFTIGETGFGTGLNFLLAWEAFEKTADEGAFLDFVSVEKFPMSVEEIRAGLSPWADRLSPYLEKMLADYPLRVPGFHRIVFDNRVALTLIFGDANDAFPEIMGHVDAWFLDGFTPAKNPDMWTDTVFHEMARLSHADTSFATFTAAGFVKRGLQAAGFSVEKKKGFGRKRDMMAGFFTSGEKLMPVDPVKRIDILGAGLAGTSCAYVLRRYGFEPVLHDPNGVANGASGNPLGIINPRFTAFRSPESDFYTAAYAQALRTLKTFKDIGFQQCGSLHLITDEDKEKRLTRTAQNWGWHDDHMRVMDAQSSSDVSGVALNQAALYLPDSAQVNPSLLCAAYAKGLEVRKEETTPEGVVIFANGTAVLSRPELSFLPIHTVRGQIVFVEATPESARLKSNLCYGGYISAAADGGHVVGSTFQKWLDHTDVLEEDNAAILDNLATSVPALSGPFKVKGARASLRVASRDRFPVVGRGAENAYVSTAHGSHGIASSIACAHLLADELRGGIRSLGKSTIAALSPARFAGKTKS